jgi:soluble lytic murein transglycosylase-like protein
MKRIVLLMLFVSIPCLADAGLESRKQAEYYAAAYAKHYGIPLEFIRAVIEQESGWHPCAVSSKGAVGLMQLMPETAARLGVRNRCDVKQNISGGVRYLAELSQRFHGDLRLVAAAYYAGERVVAIHGLGYSNRDVVTYVFGIRAGVDRQKRSAVHRAAGRRQ